MSIDFRVILLYNNIRRSTVGREDALCQEVNISVFQKDALRVSC